MFYLLIPGPPRIVAKSLNIFKEYKTRGTESTAGSRQNHTVAPGGYAILLNQGVGKAVGAGAGFADGAVEGEAGPRSTDENNTEVVLTQGVTPVF